MKPGRSRVVAAALCLVALFATAGAAQPPPLLACSGPIGRSADAAGLAQLFGAKNVKRGRIPAAEGTTLPGTLVFPDDPRRRIDIVWHDDKARRRPEMVRVGAESIWRVAVAADRSVGIGTSLAELERLNGRPFTITGFEWDYGGYVDWNGGALSRIPGGCIFGVRLRPDPDGSEEDLRAVSGDREFSSASPAMRAAAPRVESLTLGWTE
ncbi:hypothetical protein [Aquabacter spiritensis]|uniref:Uncharacterized protein n=1 Tax=Aquabacter spiritensis TaxID=933073 RepID=A0A4R3M0F4_9HYPH|nr:hypothetical protein [Aquabacter spiritensis]TCT06541.1 hypothetical protein EDC64_10218 [Aquabacter spiritensis]